MQSKKLYAWETGPVDDRAIVLLCGDNPEFKAGRSTLITGVELTSHQIPASILHLDRTVRYHIHPRTAIALKTLRQRLSTLLATSMRGKALDERASKWFNLAMRCIGLFPEEEEVSIGVS